MRHLPVRSITAGVAAVVVVGRPPRSEAWVPVLRGLGGTGSPPRLDDVVALLAGTGLWVLAVWVLVALVAGRVAALPGATGALGRFLVRACVPRLLRGAVLGGVAGGLLLGPAVAASAAPGPGWPTTPAAVAATTPGPAWPTSPAPATTAPTTAAPAVPTSPVGTTPAAPTLPTSPAASTPPDMPTSPDTPAPPTEPTPPTLPATPAVPASPEPSTTGPAPGPTAVVVAPGDSLWSIAADALTRPGSPASDAKVAAAWPAWYAANRAAIGPDPGLLHPGTHLTAPTTDGSTS